MIKTGHCDMVVLTENTEVSGWADLIGLNSYIGQISYAPKNLELETLAKDYFGFDLTWVPTAILVTKTNGKWQTILNKQDLYDGPLEHKKLKQICTTGVVE